MDAHVERPSADEPALGRGCSAGGGPGEVATRGVLRRNGVVARRRGRRGRPDARAKPGEGAPTAARAGAGPITGLDVYQIALRTSSPRRAIPDAACLATAAGPATIARRTRSAVTAACDDGARCPRGHRRVGRPPGSSPPRAAAGGGQPATRPRGTPGSAPSASGRRRRASGSAPRGRAVPRRRSAQGRCVSKTTRHGRARARGPAWVRWPSCARRRVAAYAGPRARARDDARTAAKRHGRHASSASPSKSRLRRHVRRAEAAGADRREHAALARRRRPA